MPEAEIRVPHEVDDALGAAFNSSDLAFFQGLVDTILDDMIESGDYPLAAKNRDELRHRLAIAVFQCAESGERDGPALQRRVMEAFFTPASNRSAA